MVSDGYQSPGRRQRSFNRRRYVVYGVRNAKLGRPRAHYRRDIIIVVRQADHTQKHTNAHTRKTTHTPTRTATHTNARARAPAKRRSVRGRVAEWGGQPFVVVIVVCECGTTKISAVGPLHTCTSTAPPLVSSGGALRPMPASISEYHSRSHVSLHCYSYRGRLTPPPQKKTPLCDITCDRRPDRICRLFFAVFDRKVPPVVIVTIIL